MSDDKLFFLSRYNPNHVLHRPLPQPKDTGYNLRQRTHDLTLPTDINAVTKKTLSIECCSETSINLVSCSIVISPLFPTPLQTSFSFLFYVECAFVICLKEYLLTPWN